MTAETYAPEALHDKAWMAKQIKREVSWINQNMRKIPHIKDGRHVWFTEAHVEEFWKAREVKPAQGRSERSKAAARRRGGAR